MTSEEHACSVRVYVRVRVRVCVHVRVGGGGGGVGACVRAWIRLWSVENILLHSVACLIHSAFKILKIISFYTTKGKLSYFCYVCITDIKASMHAQNAQTFPQHKQPVYADYAYMAVIAETCMNYMLIP